MKHIFAAFRWIAERLKDLLYGPGNSSLDSGRLVAWAALGMMFWGMAYNIQLKQPIDLGPAGVGGGLAAVLGALVIYLFKDRQQRDG